MLLKEFARNRNKVSIRRMDLLIHAPLFKGNYNSISWNITNTRFSRQRISKQSVLFGSSCYTELYKEKNMTQLELSRRTGIATSNISDWKKKKTNPKADCLLSICDALDITPEQLLTGKGIDPEYKDADMDYEVTRADIKILKQIHSLGDEQYKRLMAYIKALQKLEQMESIVED